MSEKTPIPVILDTDIGSDIDDIWALGLLLQCPELEARLVVSASGDTVARAKINAKLLTVAGRTDVAVGVGIKQPPVETPYADWAKDFDLKSYRGQVSEDGVDATIQTIMDSPRPVTLVAIGPVPNVAEALRREPRIAGKTDFVGMHGSVLRGYNGSAEVSKEYNVIADIPACQAVFTAPWRSMTITPVDTCGLIRLRGPKYAAIRSSKNAICKSIVETYDMWRRGRDDEGASSVLFDTVAVYLAFTRQLLTVRQMGIRVTDDGFTKPDEAAPKMDVAVDWKDLPAFEDFLVKRLA